MKPVKLHLLILLLNLLHPSAFAAEPVRLSLASQETFVALPVIVDIKEFITKALKKENIDVTFVPLPVTRGTSLVDKGEIDGEMLRDKDSIEGFKNLVTSTNPLAIVDYVAVYLQSNKKFSHAKMKDLSCATLLNNRTIQHQMDIDKMKCLELKNLSQIFQMLKARRVDYILMAREVIESYCEKIPDWRKIYAIDEQPFASMPLYLILNKKHAALMPVVEKALRAAIKNDLQNYPRMQKGFNKNF